MDYEFGSVFFELQLDHDENYSDQERAQIRKAFYKKVGDIANEATLGEWRKRPANNPVPTDPSQMPKYIEDKCLPMANGDYKKYSFRAGGTGIIYCISPQLIVCYHGGLLVNPNTKKAESFEVPGLGRFKLVLVCATPPEPHKNSPVNESDVVSLRTSTLDEVEPKVGKSDPKSELPTVPT